MYDFNDAGPQIMPGAAPVEQREYPKYDYKTLNERLQRDLTWVRDCFPRGKMSSDRKFWCMANWRGDPPKVNGSCRIDLTGEKAGHGFDFTTEEKEDPIGAIGRATGLSGPALYSEASRLAGMSTVVPLVQAKQQPKHDSGPEIERILADARVLTGTVGELYLANRGLRAPVSSDLLFHPDLIDYAGKQGYCGLVAVIRNGMGERVGGIHRTFLLEDGSGKAPPGRKMLGPRKGGSIRLAPIGADGRIGVAEGIETALSATAIFGVPCWAGMDASGVAGWEWPPETKHVTIFADIGEAGEGAAQRLAQRLFDAGIPFVIRLPLRGDDFNDDLQKGVVSADYPATEDKAQISLEACLSEDAMALEFATRHEGKLCYVNQWKDWMMWDGKKWRPEKTLIAYDMARDLCREASDMLGEGNKKQKAALRKASTVSAIEILSRADRRLAVSTEQWDADDWVINTPGGLVDLRDGKNTGHNPKAYCTKVTSAAPTSDGCPRWMNFLEQVTDGNRELISYLKRCCGYWLTGSIREHALWFIYGPGGNGKGVFINTVTAIMDMYHIVSPAETFAEKKQDRHPTELARLNGARLVISQETEQGQYWAEARIKSLTGGDLIPARFMRGDFFTFAPKFKLCIVGNHKPQLRAVDDAIRRRFNLIPFEVDVKARFGANPNLPQELKSEYGAILRWMIDGCLEWQREGLNPPECVLAATSDYLDSEDSVGLWLRDMCKVGPDYGLDGTTLAALFDNWRNYANFNHIPAKNNKALSQQLTDRKFKKGVDRRGAFFTGIRLKTIEEQEVDCVRNMVKQ